VTVLILNFDIIWRFVIKCLNVTVYHITHNQKQARLEVSTRHVSYITYVGMYQGYNLTSNTFYIREINSLLNSAANIIVAVWTRSAVYNAGYINFLD